MVGRCVSVLLFTSFGVQLMLQAVIYWMQFLTRKRRRQLGELRRRGLAQEGRLRYKRPLGLSLTQEQR